jgi:lipoprotein-anchoring transpeptidase ErfK/SrfK
MKKRLRKFISLLLLCALALSLHQVPVQAETTSNTAADELFSEENKSVGKESGVYDAFFSYLSTRDNALPVKTWSDVQTFLAKVEIGETLSIYETAFLRSLSSYEYAFLRCLNEMDSSEEQAEKLIGIFTAAIKDGKKAPVFEQNAAMPTALRSALDVFGLKMEDTFLPGDETFAITVVSTPGGEILVDEVAARHTLTNTFLYQLFSPQSREATVPFLDTMKDAMLLEGTAESWLRLKNACAATFDGKSDPQKSLEQLSSFISEQFGTAVTLEESENGTFLSLVPESAADAEVAATPRPTKKPTRAPGNTEKPGSPTQTPPLATATPTMRATATPKPTPSNPYLIYVSKESYTIAILGLDSNNEYTRVVRQFSTGIGKAGQTRAGTYTIESKERWHSWSGNAYSPYASRHSGGLYIHGPLYSAKDSNKMLPGSYNEIGTSCSAGCLRTTCSAAAWVYYNCPVGTKIVIANDSKYEVSHPARIDSSQTYDPTDPGASPEIPITGFSLGKSTVTMVVGEAQKIAVSNILPSDNTTEGFKYTSENAEIASVSTSGTITAKSEGIVKIKVTANDVNGIYRTLTVTVEKPVTPTPAPTETASPEPSPSVEPTPSTEPTPEPTGTQPADPTPTPEPMATLEPTVEPEPTPEPSVQT